VRAPIRALARYPLVPKLGLGTGVAKLRFAASYQALAASLSREAEVPGRRCQAELGNEEGAAAAQRPVTNRAPAR